MSPSGPLILQELDRLLNYTQDLCVDLRAQGVGEPVNLLEEAILTYYDEFLTYLSGKAETRRRSEARALVAKIEECVAALQKLSEAVEFCQTLKKERKHGGKGRAR